MGESGRVSEGGRTLTVFKGAKDLRSSGRIFKEKEVMWTKAECKPCMTHEKETQLSDGWRNG